MPGHRKDMQLRYRVATPISCLLNYANTQNPAQSSLVLGADPDPDCHYLERFGIWSKDIIVFYVVTRHCAAGRSTQLCH